VSQVPKRCVIVGAGIAGLTTALAFHKFGISSLVLEKAPRLEETGAGIQLTPNATSVLARLGVLDGLVQTATNITSIDLHRASDNKPLLRLATADMGTEDAPFLAMLRADLQSALLRQVALCPSIEIAYDAEITHPFHAPNMRYACAKRAQEISPACVIGADGVWSRLRMAHGGAPAKYSGYIAHRMTIESTGQTVLTDGQSVRAFVSPDAHLVAYPVASGKCVNLVFISKSKDPTASTDQPNFSGFAREIARDLASEILWTHWPIYTVDPVTLWTLNDSTILIGDAAHAMLPFAAQGAGMAIEDGYTLAQCIARHPDDIKTAFKTYESLRRQRIEKIAKRARLNGFAYHVSGPLAAARNLVFAVRGQRLLQDLQWLYGHRFADIN
jgi:salicylate hydroxylase